MCSGSHNGSNQSYKDWSRIQIQEKVDPKLKVMEWIVEHASTLINRGQVGKDGKTPYRRIVGKDNNQGIVEFGEQVLIKPKRNKRSTRKQALASRWRHGTLVGMTSNSNEYFVVLAKGGAGNKSENYKKKTTFRKVER